MSLLSYLDTLSSKLVLKGTEKESINTSIVTLKKRLNYHFNSIEEMNIFGSYTRGTILPRKIDPNSDIDYMIVFNNNENYKPQTFLNQLKRFAEKYYSTTEVFQSSPTMVLNLNHIKFELVPAHVTGVLWTKNYYIPAPSNILGEWLVTYPNEFNNALSIKNQSENSKIKPMIRLAKYWNALNGHLYSSYSLEKYIINKNYSYYNNSIKDYFFEFALSLSSHNLSQTNALKVNRLKRIVNESNDYQNRGMTMNAESKIKEILPDFN